MTEQDPTETSCVLCRRRRPHAGYVCGTCVVREIARLGEIPMLYALLPSALEVNPVTVIDLTYPPVGGARATVVVHDVPGRRDQNGDIPVATILDSWVRDWVEQLGHVDVPRVPTVGRLASWLQVHVADACWRHPAIDEYAREIRGLVATMRRAINRDLSPVRYEAPCPYCGTKTLAREVGADWIECQDRTIKGVAYEGCGRLWGEDEYGLLARAAISEDELLSVEEAAIVARVDPATIRVWVHRGRLVPQPGETGRARFRKGDVESVAGVF